MYQNPFVYKRPLYPRQDGLIRIDRTNLIARAASGLEFGHWFSVGGGRKIGKSSFLHALIHACESEQRPHRFISVKPEELLKFEMSELMRVLAERVQHRIPGKKSLANLLGKEKKNWRDLKEFFASLPEELSPGERLVFIFDSFEVLPKPFAQDLLHALIDLRQSQQDEPSARSLQFIIAGTFDRADLEYQPGRFFSEYAMRIQLEDFSCQSIEAMLNRAAQKIGIECEPGFGRLIYELTSGAAYLVQKIGYRILETAYLRHLQPAFSVKAAEEAIDSIMKEGESTVEIMINQVEQDIKLVERLVKVLRAGMLSSVRYDRHLKRLVTIGALSEHNGQYRIRNRFLETMFKDYFTVERLADYYIQNEDYHHAKALISDAEAKQNVVDNALSALLGNMNFMDTSCGYDETIKRILQAFVNLMDSTKSCSIMILDKKRGVLKIHDAIGMALNELEGIDLRLGEGVAGWVAQVGRPRIIRDVTDEVESPDFVNRKMAHKLNIASMASLPLKGKDGIIGVINLCFGRRRDFSNTEISILKAMAAYASLAMQNAYFQYALDRYFNQVEKVRKSLLDAGHKVDLETNFQNILQLAIEISGTERACIAYRLKGEGDWLFHTLDHTESGENGNFLRFEHEDRIAGYALKVQQPQFVSFEDGHAKYKPIWKSSEWEMAVPCIIENKAQGCIIIGSKQAPELAADQKQLIIMLADAISITIRNNRIYGIARKKTQQVISANSIGEALSHENKLQKMLQLIASECLNVVGYRQKASFVWLKDVERGKLLVKATAGEAFGEEFLGKGLLIKEKSIVTWVFNTGRPRIAADVKRDNQYLETYPEAKSEIAVPLLFREEILGVIDVQSRRENDFDDQDLEMLTSVAHSAAVAVKIGELCDTRLNELKVLNQIGTNIGPSLNVKEVLQTICEEGLKAVGRDHRMIRVQVLDEQKRIPSLAEHKGPLRRNLSLKNKPEWQNSREAWVVENRRHYLSPDIAQDRSYAAASPEIKSVLVVPIMFSDRPIGLITLESCKEDDFGETELRLISGLADQAGVALENARLSENLAQTQLNLSRALETVAIEEAIAGLAHDLKNISSMIAGEAQWLRKRDREGQLNLDEVRTAMQNINDYVKKVEEFTAGLKRRTQKLPLNMNVTLLKEPIEDAIALIERKANNKNVEIETRITSTKTQARIDSARLARALFNIMMNAIDAMPNGGTLSIRTRKQDSNYRIFISDTGQGIPEDKLREVLNPFITTKESSYGLGLALTKRIIETDHKGKLLLRSKKGKGTTVEIVLPVFGNGTTKGRSRVRKTPRAVVPGKRADAPQGRANILVVNDDSMMLKKISTTLRQAQFTVTPTMYGKKAVELCKKHDYDVILLDYHLKKDRTPTNTAIDFVPLLRSVQPKTPIILSSASLENPQIPSAYYDYFLEINHEFWEKVVVLINEFLNNRAGLARAAIN